MNGFISGERRRRLFSRKTDSEPRKLVIDSKGRISIPADIRRSLGLDSGCRIILEFDLEENIIILSECRIPEKRGDLDEG